VDLQLESGEYFLKAREKTAREVEKRKQKVGLKKRLYFSLSTKCSHPTTEQQAEKVALRKAERAEAFVAPVEQAALPVEEKRKRKRESGREAMKVDKKKKHKKGVQDVDAAT
jgi:ribosomal RNA assembly protein